MAHEWTASRGWNECEKFTLVVPEGEWTWLSERGFHSAWFEVSSSSRARDDFLTFCQLHCKIVGSNVNKHSFVFFILSIVRSVKDFTVTSRIKA